MIARATAQVGGGQILIETGKIAKQADGSVTVQLGETIVIVAAVAAVKAKPGQEFFPLTVDYREKAAAAGKFPGGYFKREGRPTEKEILTCRLIDRPIRPLFPHHWFNEVQVQSIVLSADGENDPDMLAVVGASAALTLSDIPWAGPLGGVRVGRIGGKFVAFPTHTQMLESDLDLVYVGNEKEMLMFEGGAKEISETDFKAALQFAQESIQPIIAAQKELAATAGRPKRKITLSGPGEDMISAAKALAGDRLVPALLTPGKLEREDACAALATEIGAKLLEKFGEEKATDSCIKEIFYDLQKEAVRALILEQGKRLDGRGFEDIRPITGEVGVFPRAHGSAIFTRGETQAAALVTLGTSEDAQEFDSYTGGASEKKFILHYNFPNFSVGETGRISGPGRREIGHGALAERSIEPMLPLKEFPYAVRVTSEIMESNGSSSMASVCGGTLALLDAGVPMIRPVAGISVGLCTETGADEQIKKYELLTDIIGWEDAYCDMDCKIAGTVNGITGFQLDLKLPGLPLDIMSQAVDRAYKARLNILETMAKTLAAPRAELSKYAPRIVTVKINPEKIGALIGPGGKNIKRIVEESGCEINIEDDGTVNIYSVSEAGMAKARQEIEGMTAQIEVGKIYRGRVVTIKDFGCFVEVFPGQDGLVHISELANFRVKQAEDIVKMGDEIWVKCIGVDEKGRVRLSRKAAMAERDQQAGGEAPKATEPEAEVETEVEKEEAEETLPEPPEERPEHPARPERRERAERPERTPRAERPEPRVERCPDRAPERTSERAPERRSDRGERRFDRGQGRGSDRGERYGERGTADREASRGGERGAERSSDRGAERRGERYAERGSERERFADRGERSIDRGADRPERGNERYPERGADRPERGNERYPERGADRPERGNERYPERGADRPERGNERYPERPERRGERGTERESGRGYSRGSDRFADRGGERNPDRGSDRPERGNERDADRNPDRDSGRDSDLR
jgi:polyribonucleotide nucleotidyltransferase